MKNARIKFSISPLNSDRGLNGDPNYRCETLRSQYDSVFSEPLIEDTLRNMNNGTVDVVHTEIFKEGSIAKAAGALTVSAAAGPYEIAGILLKTCIEALTVSLYISWRN